MSDPIEFSAGEALVGATTYRYAECGDGVPLVFLHGGGGNRLSACHDLLARRHRVIALEQPGFGASPEPAEPLTDREYAALVATAARRIAGGAYHLVGTSFGSRIAGWIVVDRPDDVLSVALLAPAVLKVDGGPITPPPPPPGLDPEAAAKFVSQLAFVRRLLGNDTTELVDRLAVSAVPIAVAFGADDNIVPTSMLPAYAERFPAATIDVVAGAGHALYADQPEAVAAAVLGHIAAHTPTTGSKAP